MWTAIRGLGIGSIAFGLVATTALAQDGGDDANHRARLEMESAGGDSSSLRGERNPGYGGDFGERHPRDMDRDWRGRGGWDRGGRDRHDRDRHDRDRHDRGGKTRIIIGGYWGGGSWGDSWGDPWGRDRWRHGYWDRRPGYRYPDPWDRRWRSPIYSGGYPWWYGRPRTVIVWSVFPPFIYDRMPLRARGYHERAYEQAMSAPVGQSVSWADVGTAGTITTTRDGYAGERYCREFQQNVTVNGEAQDAWGVACQEPDGSWRLVKEN
jgi:hypothetical protein